MRPPIYPYDMIPEKASESNVSEEIDQRAWAGSGDIALATEMGDC